MRAIAARTSDPGARGPDDGKAHHRDADDQRGSWMRRCGARAHWRLRGHDDWVAIDQLGPKRQLHLRGSRIGPRMELNPLDAVGALARSNATWGGGCPLAEGAKQATQIKGVFRHRRWMKVKCTNMKRAGA